MGKKAGLLLLLAAVFVAMGVFSLLGFGQSIPPACSVQQDYIINGTVYNSTYGGAATNLTSNDFNQTVNVSIYNLTFSNVGEPVRSFVNSTTTNTSINPGNFSLRFTGNCFSSSGPVLYTIEAVLYNTSNMTAMEVGPQFPPLPVNVLSTFLKPAIIYLQNATTLKLYGINTTGDVINFSYIIFDDTLGFPLAENFATKVWNASVVVPRNRNYTIVFMRPPDVGDQNSFATAVPPMTYAVSTAMIEGNASSQYVLNLTQNMSFSLYSINGTINITGNTSVVNVTNIVVKLGLAGLMPPNAEISIPGGVIINTMSVGSAASGFTIANYSVTVMGSSGGIYQVLEFYASNKSGRGDSFAYFQNFSVTGNDFFNVTLQGLSGTYSAQSSGSSTIPTKYVAINITDESNQPLDDAHIELKVETPGHKTTLPTFRYMLDQLSGGVARLPIINTSNATVLIYNRRYAPFEFKLNLTNASLYPNGVINIQLQTFKPRQFNANGSVEKLSGSNKGGNFRIVMMQHSSACNVYNASIGSCKLGDNDFGVGEFDPLKSMVSGKVGIYSVLNSTGVIIHFIGVDMLASGPPEGAMSEHPLRDTSVSAGAGATRTQIWRFGSLAPPIYDRVLVGIPYNDSLYNDTALFNISFDYLLDDNGVVIWNATLDPNATAVPEAYADYNVSWFNSTGGGMRCVTDEWIDAGAQQCFVNTTTNYVWLNILHFTDIDPPLEGQADTTPPLEGPRNVNVTSSDLQSGNVNITWSDIDDETGETYIVYRFSSNITIYNLSLTNVTINRVPENAGWFLDNTTTGDNATVYYYAVVAVDAAGNLNTSTGAPNLSNSVSTTVNDAINPRQTANVSITASSGTATITWTNVTLDVNGNPDNHGLQYRLYRNSSEKIDLASLMLVNDSNSNFTLVETVAVGRNLTTTSVSSGGFFHYIITSVDDAGNENKSFLMGANYVNLSIAAYSSGSSSSSSSSSSGSSSGGGGAAAAADTEGTSQSRAWDKLSAGDEATFKITRTGILFSSIKFSVNEDVTDIEMSVTQLSTKPSYVSAAYDGMVHSYITVAKSNLKDASVSPSVVIQFKVPKKWLSDNALLAGDVVLIRYSGNKWNELPTTLTDSDAVNYMFEATSPGLSVFGIAVKPSAAARAAAAAAASKSNSTASANETSDVPEKTDAGSGVQKSKAVLFTSIVIIVVAVIVAGIGFFYYRKSKAAELASSSDEPPKPEKSEEA